MTPIKSVTIPRLELTACTTSVKLGAMIKDELKIHNLKDHYLTDSTISLGYIFNEKKRFRVFVANRTQKIRSYTSTEQWHHVDTNENPSDHASRGISVNNEKAVNQWLNGPEFLWKDISASSNSVPGYSYALKDDDPEIREQTVSVHTTKIAQSAYVVTRLEHQFSSWRKMIKIVAVMMKFSDRARKIEDRTCQFTLSVSNLEKAETAIIKMIQHKFFPEHFADFYTLAEPGSEIKTNVKEKQLLKLDPFL